RRLAVRKDAALGRRVPGRGPLSSAGRGGAMRRRRLVLVGVGLLGLGALFFVPLVRFLVLGKLRGERLHEGRPRSSWVDRLDRGDDGEREKPAHALGQVGPPAPATVAVLAAALEDGNLSVRRSAAEALHDLGPEAADAVPDLIAALGDQEPRVRR